MGWRPNRALLEEIERKLESLLGAPLITEQPRRHGSFARYMHNPMTQGYCRGGGVVGHVARCQRSRLGTQDRSSLFLYHSGAWSWPFTHLLWLLALDPARCRYLPCKVHVHVNSSWYIRQIPLHDKSIYRLWQSFCFGCPSQVSIFCTPTAVGTTTCVSSALEPDVAPKTAVLC